MLKNRLKVGDFIVVKSLKYTERHYGLSNKMKVGTKGNISSIDGGTLIRLKDHEWSYHILDIEIYKELPVYMPDN